MHFSGQFKIFVKEFAAKIGQIFSSINSFILKLERLLFAAERILCHKKKEKDLRIICYLVCKLVYVIG